MIMNKTVNTLILLTAVGLGTGAAHVNHPPTSHAPLLRSDAAKKTASLSLVAGSDQSNAGLNFNGKHGEQSTLTVPLGWTVELHYRNAGTMPHSVVVVEAPSKGMAQKLPLKFSEASAAFTGAHSKNVTGGMGRTVPTEMVRFTANKAGDYLIACGVTGHAMGGQYLKLHVNVQARVATLTEVPVTKL
ncbi:hypothetical protein BXU09_15075 [Deinococcus sp. LM3]|nr:hypothetical protein BXU09_15075 [Deinococcus sp. LM3]